MYVDSNVRREGGWEGGREGRGGGMEEGREGDKSKFFLGLFVQLS